MTDCDVCIIGSGPGAAPVISELVQKGFSVIVLEKGPWLSEKHFSKDELAALNRSYSSNPYKEPHTVEEESFDGQWESKLSTQTNLNFWNGNCVGGASNFMSGYFFRYKPSDFKLVQTFGPISGSSLIDWPIEYDDLEPYYTKVEGRIGVSGTVKKHPQQEPRSRPDFPYPPTAEHPISALIDSQCEKKGISIFPTPRAILSKSQGERKGCSYTGYCGSYGCSTGAKGSARAALLTESNSKSNCRILTNSTAYELLASGKDKKKITHVKYFNKLGISRKISAKKFVLAAGTIQSARLLLKSQNASYDGQGVANNHGQVGKNLIFSAGASISGILPRTIQNRSITDTYGPFVNRSSQHWYTIDDPSYGPKMKGGTLDILFPSPSPITQAVRSIQRNQKQIWGPQFQQNLEDRFSLNREIEIEAFADWLPNPNCFVTLDSNTKDYLKQPVAKIRAGFHPHNLTVGYYLGLKGKEVLEAIGAENVMGFPSHTPPTNLVAGACRMGSSPKDSVVNSNCQTWSHSNLYITDGSVIPTGGSVPYTWTIYANAFRIADIISNNI